MKLLPQPSEPEPSSDNKESPDKEKEDSEDSLDTLNDTLDDMIQASQLHPQHPRSLQVSVYLPCAWPSTLCIRMRGNRTTKHQLTHTKLPGLYLQDFSCDEFIVLKPFLTFPNCCCTLAIISSAAAASNLVVMRYG